MLELKIEKKEKTLEMIMCLLTCLNDKVLKESCVNVWVMSSKQTVAVLREHDKYCLVSSHVP